MQKCCFGVKIWFSYKISPGHAWLLPSFPLLAGRQAQERVPLGCWGSWGPDNLCIKQLTSPSMWHFLMSVAGDRASCGVSMCRLVLFVCITFFLFSSSSL